MAYTCHGYHAEEAVRKALTERYPRRDFLLATKSLRDFRDEQDMEDIFQEQSEHCGVKLFDCYLLHNMGYNVYEKCCRYGRLPGLSIPGQRFLYRMRVLCPWMPEKHCNPPGGECSGCAMCGQCEKACPQKLPIRSY